MGIVSHGVSLGAPPFTDDLLIPLADFSPLGVIQRAARAAEILEQVANNCWFTIHYGPGKTELVLAVRGSGWKQALGMLRAHEKGESTERAPWLPLNNGKALCVAMASKHIGKLLLQPCGLVLKWQRAWQRLPEWRLLCPRWSLHSATATWPQSACHRNCSHQRHP